MLSFLSILAVAGVVIVVLAYLFVAQIFITPTLVAGTLSEPQALACENGRQWLLYDCNPNPLTGFGCIIPGSDGEFITHKRIAIFADSCLPLSNGAQASDRYVAFRWEEQGVASVCATAPTGTTCCNYNSSCLRTARFLCVPTGEREDGENQCVPDFLPGTANPPFNKDNYDYTKTEIIVQIPCRENYCATI